MSLSPANQHFVTFFGHYDPARRQPQRERTLDYVFLRSSTEITLQTAAAQPLFVDQDGLRRPLSDHQGVLLNIGLRSLGESFNLELAAAIRP